MSYALRRIYPNLPKNIYRFWIEVRIGVIYTSLILKNSRNPFLEMVSRNTELPSHRSITQLPLNACRSNWLVLKPAKQLTVEQAALLTQLRDHPALTAAIDLAQDFAQLLLQRQPEQLDL